MADTHYIFGKTRKIDRSYVSAQLIEDIQDTIQKLKSQGQLDKLDRYYLALAKVISDIPANTASLPKVKKVVVYNLPGTKTLEAPMSTTDAIALLKNKIYQSAEPIDYEPGDK